MDGIAIESSETFSAANRTTFQQTLYRHESSVGSASHSSASQSSVRVRESNFAGETAPALNTTLSEVPEFLSVTVVTNSACHSVLVFPAGQADNEFASALRLVPRADLALDPVSAGAFLVGGRDPIWTGIPQFWRLVLFQLSYAPTRRAFKG